MFGFILTYIKINKQNEHKLILLTLSISLIILLYISIFDLIPCGFINLLNNNHNLLLNTILTVILASCGVGVVEILDHKKNANNLYKLGILCMLSIMLHNIPEGIITFISNINNETIGLKITIGILIHNIPEGILIALPIYYSTKSHLKSFIYTFIASISETFGGLIFYLLFKDIITYQIIYYLMIVVGGIMIDISINKILTQCFKIYQSKIFNIGIVVGLIITLLMHIFI